MSDSEQKYREAWQRRNRVRWAKATPEQREKLRTEKREWARAKAASLTQEEREERNRYHREWAAKKYASDPEARRKSREAAQARRERLIAELGREKYLELKREDYHRNREANLARAKRYRRENPEKAKAADRKRYGAEKRRRSILSRKLAKRFGQSLEWYDRTLKKQGGKCAICQRDFSGFKVGPAVDHDRNCCPGSDSCGQCVRGLLCGSCNTALGRFGDGPERLRSALRYVNKHLRRRK